MTNLQVHFEAIRENARMGSKEVAGVDGGQPLAIGLDMFLKDLLGAMACRTTQRQRRAIRLELYRVLYAHENGRGGADEIGSSKDLTMGEAMALKQFLEHEEAKDTIMAWMMEEGKS